MQIPSPFKFTCVGVVSLVLGCVAPAQTEFRSEPPTDLQQSAMEVLTSGIQDPTNPIVRVQAVEALESVGGENAKSWIRSALLDGNPAVRFAACVAAGMLGDRAAAETVEQKLRDENASVRLAALFARHRLGRTDRTGELTGYLLQNSDISVRRNAAMVMGLLGEQGAIKVLARAMRDSDPGVRQNVLEAMARLGNKEARQELTFRANSGVGSEEVLALIALIATKDRSLIDTYRYKLTHAEHLETKLAAARGLGTCGSDDGYSIAMQGLQTTKQLHEDRDDPPADQILRTRQLAAAALGAIGLRDAIPALQRALDSTDDARLKISFARAVLEIQLHPVDLPPNSAHSGPHR
ncbi:MAG: HEAT repeat domain-containing protein [Planctomycetes bacterium]|nr:HEAT repeat domain-containing protein [Planctomycetota bacterium]MBI3833746.1 HEAT repeat domain-containing protein [Planctomycetota bacterium]